MENKLLVFDAILVAAWFIGFLVFHASPTIHILLILAAIVFLFSLLYNKSFMR
jgi:hypothetical protein